MEPWLPGQKNKVELSLFTRGAVHGGGECHATRGRLLDGGQDRGFLWTYKSSSGGNPKVQWGSKVPVNFEA